MRGLVDEHAEPVANRRPLPARLDQEGCEWRVVHQVHHELAGPELRRIYAGDHAGTGASSSGGLSLAGLTSATRRRPLAPGAPARHRHRRGLYDQVHIDQLDRSSHPRHPRRQCR